MRFRVIAFRDAVSGTGSLLGVVDMLGSGMMDALRFAGRVRMATIGVAVLLIALVATMAGYGSRGVLVPLGTRMGASVADAAGAGVADVMTLLDMRSPGARGSGALVQTKRARETARPTGMWILDPLRPMAAVPPQGVMPVIAIGGFAPSRMDVPRSDIGGWSSPVGGTAAGPAFAFDDGSSSYGDETWDPVGPVAIGPGTGMATGPVQSAVPEPSTWAMMILGVFLVGAAMRRRRADGLPAL